MMEVISFNYLGIELSGDELKPNGNKKMQCTVHNTCTCAVSELS